MFHPDWAFGGGVASSARTSQDSTRVGSDAGQVLPRNCGDFVIGLSGAARTGSGSALVGRFFFKCRAAVSSRR